MGFVYILDTLKVRSMFMKFKLLCSYKETQENIVIKSLKRRELQMFSAFRPKCIQ
jgi:hypothetical protein